ncbi:MAG: SMP-30/gluconolactonase/LRE family protein [Candidatus Latescibacteria bacterium]|jgi:D-xylonolactonase|nr:SMP-30/gluconolactonase/LRE family protein [Candidatus Latescibacterota bacterium]
MQPELIADYACKTGEGPIWHPLENRLYWLDIPAGRMFRYDPADGTHEPCYGGDVVGGFTIQADGALLLFMARCTVKIWRDGRLTTLIEGIPGEEEARFNDVIADPVGRVFCGTMATANRPGRLYRLDTDGEISEVVQNVGCSNGMGFTLDQSRMYYTDSTAHEITLFDYDSATGAIDNRRSFVTVDPDDGIPDGMTVDAEGYVWSARWDGGCLVRYTPEGEEEQRIPFPARKVSSVTFGGPDCDQMYVITAGGDNKPEEGEGAGALFRVAKGVHGVPEFYSRICL